MLSTWGSRETLTTRKLKHFRNPEFRRVTDAQRDRLRDAGYGGRDGLTLTVAEAKLERIVMWLPCRRNHPGQECEYAVCLGWPLPDDTNVPADDDDLLKNYHMPHVLCKAGEGMASPFSGEYCVRARQVSQPALTVAGADGALRNDQEIALDTTCRCCLSWSQVYGLPAHAIPTAMGRPAAPLVLTTEEEAAEMLRRGRCLHGEGVTCKLVICKGTDHVTEHLYCLTNKAVNSYCRPLRLCATCRTVKVSDQPVVKGLHDAITQMIVLAADSYSSTAKRLLCCSRSRTTCQGTKRPEDTGSSRPGGRWTCWRKRSRGMDCGERHCPLRTALFMFWRHIHEHPCTRTHMHRSKYTGMELRLESNATFDSLSPDRHNVFDPCGYYDGT